MDTDDIAYARKLPQVAIQQGKSSSADESRMRFREIKRTVQAQLRTLIPSGHQMYIIDRSSLKEEHVFDVTGSSLPVKLLFG